MTSPIEHIGNLRQLLGEKGLLTDADKVPYEQGARYDMGKSAFVMRPATTREVSQAVAYCVSNGIHIVPQAGNTGLVSGSTSDQSGLQAILSVDRLNRTIELDRDNRSVRADAGVLLSDLNEYLAPSGLFFPIDLGANPRLGGMISTNTGGARFVKYGDVRRNTLGLTVVLADSQGSVMDLRNDLRKNNTGVDWKQIFIGTSGSFGIITECVINVEPLPRQSASVMLVPADAEKIMPLLHAMEMEFGSDLTAFEGMSKNAIAAAFAHVPSLRNPFRNGEIPDYVILAEVSRTYPHSQGEPTLEEWVQSALGNIWERDETLLEDALFGPSEPMWAIRHALSEGVKQLGKLVAFDLAFRRGDVMPFCERMRQEVASRFPEVTICDFGHIADGGVHFNLVIGEDGRSADNPSLEWALRDWIYDVVVSEYDGSFSAEHAIGRKNQGYYDKFTPQLLKEMAENLKRMTSPGGLGTVRLG
ncbi:FAD-binding oxidoreductase [Agrobacterium larrymoorei]|uniref:FAD-binding oxidoreductase n=1 Tax=Agrobacterium larrymoorei TaxID=160699 RepID=A0AAF0HCF1_9HYPH|nr:FAD-binding oxidoreductase [Agrobacterium larrymoorei]WHA43906.1 FAD-binding oxidoreductase [Agrobacterium larrymoorei]